MIVIETPNAIPHGLHHLIQVKNEEEALKLADGRKSYFYRSHTTKVCYLIVPVEGE